MGQSSMELLLILGGVLAVAVIALVTLQNTGESTGSNLVLTNAKNACSLLITQNACEDLDIVDVSKTGSCPSDCCWNADATPPCSLNPTARVDA